MLATIDLGAVSSEILNLHMHSQAMSLRAEAEAQQVDFMMPCIRYVIKRGTSIGNYRQKVTQEQSTALSRPHRFSGHA